MADEPEVETKSPDNELSLEKSQDKLEFPEGGARAWGAALGCAGIMFCTFGFANSFGYDGPCCYTLRCYTNDATVSSKNIINRTNCAAQRPLPLHGSGLCRSSSCWGATASEVRCLIVSAPRSFGRLRLSTFSPSLLPALARNCTNSYLRREYWPALLWGESHNACLAKTYG